LLGAGGVITAGGCPGGVALRKKIKLISPLLTATTAQQVFIVYRKTPLEVCDKVAQLRFSTKQIQIGKTSL